ncbi:MspA family porin [Mycobacteroides salmoniphilum]|uniref:Porin MspC n=1 Tax=Mycobacteroides salmoniphilum TaxID=404941 RepID=A0A4R8SJR7_9MYCO|nr:Porin MspC precursor [Mycobacteroides salmoniphilum]
MRRVGIWQVMHNTLMRLVLVVAGVVSLAVIGTGTATAGLDDELTLVDGKGRTLRIQQWDTFLNGVFPLDRNRLTREWFHSGRAAYEVTGPAADTFEGTLELGYQVGYPWSLGVGLNFNYTTPNTSILYGIPNAFGGGINVDLGNGPGIQEVATFSVAIAGPKGAVAVSNAHGTVTGAAGGVLLRPYARLISSAGDSVTTYGETWDMK